MNQQRRTEAGSATVITRQPSPLVVNRMTVDAGRQLLPVTPSRCLGGRRQGNMMDDRGLDRKEELVRSGTSTNLVDEFSTTRLRRRLLRIVDHRQNLHRPPEFRVRMATKELKTAKRERREVGRSDDL